MFNVAFCREGKKKNTVKLYRIYYTLMKKYNKGSDWCITEQLLSGPTDLAHTKLNVQMIPIDLIKGFKHTASLQLTAPNCGIHTSV